MVRMLQAPTSLPAILPHGPMEEETVMLDPVEQSGKPIDERYAELANRTTAKLGKLIGKDLDGSRSSNEWADVPKFVWRNAADPKATDEARSSPVSRAWKRSLSWLRKVQAASTSTARDAAVWKLLHYRHDLLVHEPLLQEDAAAFRAWNGLITRQMLRSSSWVRALTEVAMKAADLAEHKAAVAATQRFAEWIQEGPAAGLRRQHLFARTATGWTQDAADQQQPTNLSELDDLEGVSLVQLRAALEPSEEAGTPIGAQFSANVERARWGAQWAAGSKPDELQWPEDMPPLTPVSLRIFKGVLFSFPAGTGLGVGRRPSQSHAAT